MPPAAAPCGPLTTGVPGLLAVPLRFTLSEICPPSTIGGDASVGTAGVTGVTVKHSVAEASLASGMPVVPDANSPRQQ